jgi:hypothetical protein
VSYFTAGGPSGIPPHGAERVVYLFRLQSRTLAVRLMVLPTGQDLAQYCRYSRPSDPLYFSFNPAHLQARAGRHGRLLAELRLARDLADWDCVSSLAFHVADFCERNGHGSSAECADLACHIAGQICDDLHCWRVPVVTARREVKYVHRFESNGCAALAFSVDNQRCTTWLQVESADSREVAPFKRQLRLPLFPDDELHDQDVVRGRHWSDLGRIFMRPDEIGFDVIVRQVYALLAPLRRKRHLDDFLGATLCGELVVSVCRQLEQAGTWIPRCQIPPPICRIQDRWRLLPG